MTDEKKHISVEDVQKKMAHRLELSKKPLCLQCEFDSSMYGSAFHHEENGHIPFEEAVKIIIYQQPQNNHTYHGKSLVDIMKND